MALLINIESDQKLLGSHKNVINHAEINKNPIDLILLQFSPASFKMTFIICLPLDVEVNDATASACLNSWMQATQDYTIKNPLAIADVDALQCNWRLLEYNQNDAGDSDGDNNTGGVTIMTMAVLLLKSTFSIVVKL